MHSRSLQETENHERNASKCDPENKRRINVSASLFQIMFYQPSKSTERSRIYKWRLTIALFCLNCVRCVKASGTKIRDRMVTFSLARFSWLLYGLLRYRSARLRGWNTGEKNATSQVFRAWQSSTAPLRPSVGVYDSLSTSRTVDQITDSNRSMSN